MRKYQFSQSGIAAMQADYYQLNDVALGAFADEMAKDFKRWAVQHLEFSTSQVQDLESLHEQSITFLALQGSFALRNRLPIHLIKPVTMDSDLADKLVKPFSNLYAISDREGNFSTAGEFVVEIAYVPKAMATELEPEDLFAIL